MTRWYEAYGITKPYYADDAVCIVHADCRDILPLLPDKSIDLVLTDPPYGITSNDWDKPMPVGDLWILLWKFHTWIFTASQPYSSQLIHSAISEFKHEWIWVKNRGSNFANTVREPMKEHEHVLVFSRGEWVYNPILQKRKGTGEERVKYGVAFKSQSENYRGFEGREHTMLPNQRIPSSVQFFNTEVGLHPTQKPLSLFGYLVATYSDTGNVILDPFMGSGTTLKAAKNLNRRCIGIEMEEKYCEIAAKRCSQSVMRLES